MLTVTGAPGLVYLNGRLCGETGAAAMPLARNGVQYLELRPFDTNRSGAVLRLRMENGRLVEGISGDVFAVQWPDGWIALEMRDVTEEAAAMDTPPKLLAQLDMPGGRYLLVSEGGVPSFGRNADEALFLPITGVTDASLRPLPYAGLCAAEGAGAEGRFAAVLRAEGAPEMVLCASGASVRLDAQGVLHALEAAGDLVGHASKCVWAPDAQGRYALKSREPAWLEGGPRWPATPLDTARAWLEAMRLSMREEAAGYLLRPENQERYERLVGLFDTVTALPPDGGEGVRWGVLRMEGPNLATVRRLTFSTRRQPGAQGDFKIEDIVEETACD